MKIYCLDNSEEMQHDSLFRGYRGDIYVEIDSDYFKLNIYDSTRIIQDFENDLLDYGYFQIEPNIVLVKEVSNKEIKFVLDKMYRNKYFNYIKKNDIIPEDLQLLE